MNFAECWLGGRLCAPTPQYRMASWVTEVQITASNLRSRKASWADSNFLNVARTGDVIGAETYTFDPNAHRGPGSCRELREACCELHLGEPVPAAQMEATRQEKE